MAMPVQGFGMRLAMAPATESVMGSIPSEHVGVGSAINDALREIGGALGVAVIASVAASLYNSHLDSAVRHLQLVLTERAVYTIRTSLGAALGLAARPGSPGTQLAHAGRSAFTDGFQVATGLAGLALVGAVIAVIFLAVQPEQTAHATATRDPDRLPSTTKAENAPTSAREDESAA
jgi:DHA2 family multidrug resistance protein-like MFS transporter